MTIMDGVIFDTAFVKKKKKFLMVTKARYLSVLFFSVDRIKSKTEHFTILDQ